MIYIFVRLYNMCLIYSVTDPVIIECGDIVNTSLSRNEVDRYILSGCNEIENITFSTCGGITSFDTQIRVDSFTEVSQVGYKFSSIIIIYNITIFIIFI